MQLAIVTAHSDEIMISFKLKQYPFRVSWILKDITLFLLEHLAYH
jgi:hypothetical protein